MADTNSNGVNKPQTLGKVTAMSNVTYDATVAKLTQSQRDFVAKVRDAKASNVADSALAQSLGMSEESLKSKRSSVGALVKAISGNWVIHSSVSGQSSKVMTGVEILEFFGKNPKTAITPETLGTKKEREKFFQTTGLALRYQGESISVPGFGEGRRGRQARQKIDADELRKLAMSLIPAGIAT